MIQLLTIVQIRDNTGAIQGKCIKIKAAGNKKIAQTGDLILISIVKTQSSSTIKKGEIYKALVIQTTKEKNNVRNGQNSVILVKTTPKSNLLTPIGSTIKATLPYDIRKSWGCSKILSLSPSVI